MLIRRRTLLAASAAATVASPAIAQNYPRRAVQLVVAFPAGGCAYLHRHAGPGIRCLLEGGIRIDTHGVSTSYGPGGAWYESGPDPVFAQAAADRPTRFIRAMILPRELQGRSSIQYVNAEDMNKPRVQQYRVFADLPIARRISAVTGSLCVPSPRAMNELRNGCPSTVPRTFTRPRVPKNSAEPGICT